jgi:DNA polymerase-3 subunit epsilon
LLDSQLLAKVYLELMGGRQHGLGLGSEETREENKQDSVSLPKRDRPYREPRLFAAPPEEKAAHQKMLDDLKDHLWGTAV